MTQYCWFYIMFLSDKREDTYATLFVRNIHMYVKIAKL